MFFRTDYFINSLVPNTVSFASALTESATDCLFLYDYDRQSLRPVFQSCIEEAKSRNLPIEILHHPLDNGVKGIFLPLQRRLLLSTAFYEEQAAHRLAALYPTQAKALQDSLHHAQNEFKAAHVIHDEKEKIYVQSMDFEFLDILADALVHRLLREDKTHPYTIGKTVDRFFGAALAEENIDYIDALTDTLEKRYLIEGRPGSGKSTFLKKVAHALTANGIDVQLYHCSMDSNSLDMILAPELSVAAFDCTPPHAYKPHYPRDEVIDLYKECIVPHTDEKYAERLSALDAQYRTQIEKGRAALQALAAAEKEFYAALPPLSQKQLEEIQQDALSFLFG